MSSITEPAQKSSDQLKEEVDSALANVGQDLDQLKGHLTPENIVDEVILKDRLTKVREGFAYMEERPYLLVGAGLVGGFLLALAKGRSRPQVTYVQYR